MNTQIDVAIRERREIEFTYDGHLRVVQPAAHGRHKDTGNEVLRGYQIGGGSNSRQPPLWDLFLVAKINSLTVTDRRFTANPPHYSQGDKHMKPIITELS